MFRFYDLDEKGHYRTHQFDKEESMWGFWIFLILGFLLPIGIMAFCA